MSDCDWQLLKSRSDVRTRTAQWATLLAGPSVRILAAGNERFFPKEGGNVGALRATGRPACCVWIRDVGFLSAARLAVLGAAGFAAIAPTSFAAAGTVGVFWDEGDAVFKVRAYGAVGTA